ncbi:xyloglucan endotransglucosylase/hydrolase protein 2-like protein [Tanacetum coccineum]
MRIKLPDRDSAGVVAAFFLNLNGGVHDELDFKFMGNRQREASFCKQMYSQMGLMIAKLLRVILVMNVSLLALCMETLRLFRLILNLIQKGYRLEYSELREYTHGFFSNVAEILEDGMVQVTPVKRDAWEIIQKQVASSKKYKVVNGAVTRAIEKKKVKTKE